MDAYVYQADLYCESCAHDIMVEQGGFIRPTKDREDSEEWPQGPYSDGGGEVDCPQHCEHCHEFLENPLTGDGRNYVHDAIIDWLYDGEGKLPNQWAEFYGVTTKDLIAYVANRKDKA